MENRLKDAMLVLKEANLIGDLEPDELLDISRDVNSKDYKKVAKIVAYIRKRVIEKKSRQDSFRYAFPERCVVTREMKYDDRYAKRKDGTFVEVGDALPKTTIEIKAKRLEDTRLYKSVMVLLNTSVYASYALDRMRVLDLNLEKIFDPEMKEHNRIEYMKMFLAETRKPEKTSEFEVNVNIQQNDISIEQINNKLEVIASSLEGANANSIIDMMEKK